VEASDRSLCGRLSRAAVTLRARAVEDDLPLLLERVERRIGIRQRRGAGRDRVGEGANPLVREQRPLKGGQVVKDPRRRRTLDLRVVGQRAERLRLERPRPGVELITTKGIGVARPVVLGRRTAQRNVVHARDHPPHVHELLA
jgi:hypothetical protein